VPRDQYIYGFSSTQSKVNVLDYLAWVGSYYAGLEHCRIQEIPHTHLTQRLALRTCRPSDMYESLPVGDVKLPESTGLQTLWRLLSSFIARRKPFLIRPRIDRRLFVWVLAVLLLGIWLTFEWLKVTPESYMNYGIIIDAGSSGSRIYIYSYQYLNGTDRLPHISLAEDPPPSIIRPLPLASMFVANKPNLETNSKKWQLKIEPGISSFADHPQKVGIEHLKPLLDFADTKLPHRKRRKISLHILATAGMRMIDSERQSSILQHACDYVKSNYLYRFDCDNLDVISGEMEGVYGWISVNYLLHRFPTQKFLEISGATNETEESSKTSYGFLDLGGGSTQIALETDAEGRDDIPRELLHEVILRDGLGRPISYHNLYVSTYLGFGANTARRKHIDQMLDLAAQTSSLVEDPCLPRDYNYQGHLIGTGDVSGCIEKLRGYLNKSATCPVPPCSFNGVHQPNIDFGRRRFIGVSEFWYTSNDIYRLGGIYDYTNFKRTTESFCSTPWSLIHHMFMSSRENNMDSKSIVDMSRLESQCFKAAWMMTLLHEGYGFPCNVTSPTGDVFLLKTANELGDKDVSWTLGALLMVSTSNALGRSLLSLIKWDMITLIAIMACFLSLICKHRRDLCDWSAKTRNENSR
jgi:golgi apyrase